uniref:Uncharacterized protein n=1 Tax=Glossina pallidipes TaxID=7398 RepID=A0A1A9ZXN8_GLOPL
MAMDAVLDQKKSSKRFTNFKDNCNCNGSDFGEGFPNANEGNDFNFNFAAAEALLMMASSAVKLEENFFKHFPSIVHVPRNKSLSHSIGCEIAIILRGLQKE